MDRRFRHYFMLYPFAVEKMDLTEYDLLFSSSSGYAKGVHRRRNAIHVCYCHTPMRWVWRYEDYVAREKFNRGVRTMLPFFLWGLRKWDLRAAQQRIDAAKQGVSAVKLERLPAVSLFGNDGGIGKSHKYLLNTYQYGVQISLPLFDGFRREGRVQEQTAQVREAELRAKDLRDQAEADIRGALLDLASAREQVDATRERLRLADQEVSQARERFRAGVAGNADVITASLSLTDARTAAIDALTNYHAARVALARAEGTVTTLP